MELQQPFVLDDNTPFQVFDSQQEADLNLSHQSAVSTPARNSAVTSPFLEEPCLSTEANAPVLMQEEKENISEELPMDVLLRLKNEANSRRNFAFKQAEKMFSYEERLTSNCQGKRGKKQLDPKRVDVIRRNTIKLWPLENKEEEGSAWNECRRAIDEGGRQLNYRVKLQNKTLF